MPARKLPAAQRQTVEQRVADLASKVAAMKGEDDASKLAEQLEDLGNRFLDLADWLTLPSIRLDDAGVMGRGGGAA